MKKVALLAVSGVLMLTSLTACGGQDLNTILPPVDEAQVLASGTKTLSMKKDDTSTVKNAAKLDAKFDNKKDSTAKKTVENPTIKFSPVVKNDFDSRNYAMQARWALNSMNSSYNYESGYRVGMQALNSMASNGVYVARVSVPAGDATKNWQSGYKVVAAALNHIAADRPNTPDEACNLVLNMMSSTVNWEDGYRVGMAAMRVIGQTDNMRVKDYLTGVYRSAESARTYQDAYNYIAEGFKQLRFYF